MTKPATTPDAPSAILFDFDGVIVDSEPLHFRGFRETAAREGIALTDAEYYRELIGFDDRGAWKHLFSLHSRTLSDSKLLELIAHKAAFMQDLIIRREFDVLPGVRELVATLHRHTLPLAICSGALRGEILPMLDGLQLRHAFGVIVAAEDVDVGKPDPRGYVLTMQRVSEMIGRQLSPRQCLIIEDAPVVAARARAIGFNVIGVSTTFAAEHWPAEIETVPSLEPKNLRTRIPQLIPE